MLEHSGLKVSSLYIAQVKQQCGIIDRENYNKQKSEDAKQPQCPPDKEKAIKEALRHFGMIQSLSGTGHCFDNARMESLFATLKKEKIYRIAAYKHTREEVKTIIFRYVFIYYNRIRIYTTNPYGLSPCGAGQLSTGRWSA